MLHLSQAGSGTDRNDNSTYHSRSCAGSEVEPSTTLESNKIEQKDYFKGSKI